MRISKKLIIRYLSNECTEAEEARIHALQQKNPELERELNALKQVWSVKKIKNAKVDVDAAWQNVKAQTGVQYVFQHERRQRASFEKIVQQSVPSFSTAVRVFVFAMILIMAIAIPCYIYHIKQDTFQSADILSFQTIKVKKGKRYTVTLSDGSKVTLDAGSELEYPTVFSEKRKVFLKGEAYFNVAHNPNRPFYVNTNHAVVKVLGTRFNIRAWDENPRIIVAVQNGKVLLSNRYEETESVLLTKGKFSSMSQAGYPSEPVDINFNDYVGWMHNEIYFRDASVREVLAQFERWYDFHFSIEDETILEKRLTVHLQKTNVDDVIELIAVLTNTKIIRNGNEIKFSRK